MGSPVDDQHEEMKRRRSSSSATSTASTRRRREAIASRYIALILLLSLLCTVSTLLINNRLTPYFELTSTTIIDQPSLQTSEATSKSIGGEVSKMFYQNVMFASYLTLKITCCVQKILLWWRL